MLRVDIHQHLWSREFVDALAARDELPFVAHENDLTVLYLAGERPYVIDVAAEEPERRKALVHHDGLDRALICISSPLGIEWLPREQAVGLIEAYHEGALALEQPFGVWAAIALDRADPDDVDRALERGCVGLSLPAAALASVDGLTALAPVLERLERRGAPLFVHPGAPPDHRRERIARDCSFGDPLWWPALTGYVAGMQAAYLAFLTAGRTRHPALRVIFSMLAGLAPLHAERLGARGGPLPVDPDPLTFFETSSYGPLALAAITPVVGRGQLLYGSDRPVVEPAASLGQLDWARVAETTLRALGPGVALSAA